MDVASITKYYYFFPEDFNEAVPETERLDSKALKTRVQLSVKNKRSRPTRTRLYDSISSTDGEDSLERKVMWFFPPSHQLLRLSTFFVVILASFWCSSLETFDNEAFTPGFCALLVKHLFP